MVCKLTLHLAISVNISCTHLDLTQCLLFLTLTPSTWLIWQIFQNRCIYYLFDDIYPCNVFGCKSTVYVLIKC